MNNRSAHEIPRLVQRDGVFNVVWTEPSVRDPVTGQITQLSRSRRFGLRTRDAGEAQARYAAFLAQGKEAFARDVGTARLTVAKALDDYFREHVIENVADRRRQADIIFHLKQFFGELPLSDIDIPKCRSYADARRAGVLGGGTRLQGESKKGSEATIKRELGVLQAAVNHAARWRRIGPAAMPPTSMPTFEMPRVPHRTGEAPWIDKPGIELLLKASEGPLHHFIELAYWWAARRGWVERLHVSQINFDTGRVNPYKPGERVTNKRRGMMPIFPEIRGTLETLAANAENGFLFWQCSNFYHEFKRLTELAGYEDRGHPHVLRHSRATHMLMDGVSIYKVARLLGDSVQTIERTYGHWSPEYLAERGG